MSSKRESANDEAKHHDDNDACFVNNVHTSPHIWRPRRLWPGWFFCFAIGFGLGGTLVAFICSIK